MSIFSILALTEYALNSNDARHWRNGVGEEAIITAFKILLIESQNYRQLSCRTMDNTETKYEN